MPRKTSSKMSSVKPWGEEHPRRGANYEDAACVFIADHGFSEVGITLDAFDKWAWSYNLLPTLSPGCRRGSAEWKAHVGRRLALKNGINRAATTSKVPMQFVIDVETAGQSWRVVRPSDAIERKALSLKPIAVANRRKKQIDHWLQGLSADSMPPRMHAYAVSLHDEADMFLRRTELEAEGYNRKVDRFVAEVRRAIASGECKGAQAEALSLLANSLPSIN